MKILQIAPAWIDTPPKDYGGTELVIDSLVKGLVNIGHEVTLFATKKSKTPANLEYVFEKSFLDKNIPWIAALPSFIHYNEAFSRAQDFDIVHAHLSSDTDPMIMGFLANLTVPSVMTIHSRLPLDKFSHMDKYFMKLYANKISAISISKTMLKELPRGFRNMGFVHNSLDLSKFKFNPNKGEFLTWLGKILPAKGLYEAIMASKKAGEQLIFGGVVDNFREDSINYFEQKIKPLIDGNQIKYLGPADLRLKNYLFSNAKAFLNPINWVEPFGMVMAESMACGTPVISFDRGAASELIVDKKTGFLVKTFDQMVETISKIYEINRADCRQHMENNFSPETAAEKTTKILFHEINRFWRERRKLTVIRRKDYETGYSI